MNPGHIGGRRVLSPLRQPCTPNEVRSAELAITSLISNKRKWNNCFIKFLKFQKFEVRNTSKISEKIGAKSKNELDEDVMLCNTLWSDKLVRKKHFLPLQNKTGRITPSSATKTASIRHAETRYNAGGTEPAMPGRYFIYDGPQQTADRLTSTSFSL